MKSLLLALCALALMAMVHSVPFCVEFRCGGYNYMGSSSYGYASANVGGSGAGYEVGEESIGGGGGMNGNGGGGAGYEGGGGSGYQGGGGSGYQGGGGNGYQGGGGSGYQGGGGSGYQGGGGYNPPRRNSNCPNCYVRDFGNGKYNANTINIKHRRN